jgi:tetratricopeptide (TPR) repeat protein
VSRSEHVLAGPPDPGGAASLDDLVQRLRLLKVWAGNPSFETITARINAAWRAQGRPDSELAGRTTVLDCFRPGRRRLNAELVAAAVAAMHPDVGYVGQWRQALQVVAEAAHAAAQVRVQDGLPPDLAGFVGRAAELRELRQALLRGTDGSGAPVICAIAGMPGVGKTRLAVQAGQLLADERRVERVLFADLRGFHPEPAQPPADPAAVLEGFLRLLGTPGQRIPHGLEARTAAYRGRLAGTRTLVLLDNAAGADQVRALLPATPGCPVIVTSRSRLAALRPTTDLTLDVFTPDESVAFLARVAPQVPTGRDPDAAARIGRRCGHLPLALGLVGAHIRETAGWTLTDHAERLDEHRHHRRPDLGVALALDLSYRRLPAGARHLLRLAALHPGQDVDAHAAAALTGSDLPTAEARLEHLCRDHLMQHRGRGRYAMHELVRAYAIDRAGDEDPPSGRRAALTRLFDLYVAGAATAMDTLYPTGTRRRQHAGPPTPDLAGPEQARAWLDTERPVLLAVAGHTAAGGWPAHGIGLSITLFQYLFSGYLADALTVHGRALVASRQAGDARGKARALTDLGVIRLRWGDHEPATAEFRRALRLFRQVGDRAGEAAALVNLGVAETLMGRTRPAAEHHAQALSLFDEGGDPADEAHALINLGVAEGTTGRHAQAVAHLQRALALYRQLGDRTGTARALNTLGDVECAMGRHGPAAAHLEQALALYRRLGDRLGEAWALHNYGTLSTRLGRSTPYHQQALAIFSDLA